ncbi:hypothetical protein [Amycolatopsis sp. WQ 127309]|uniref:hypothetical protein n=1 Tax=Amycolatopsis sp. WQ 127309 TaxID=2932773 RepID=UPI001FF495E9|nr:hypothetical protein [Amycolatopsis sp. WQ 127309]UOZ05498.1 hypothetical protein MUY22_42820 [Amycolatopsis sp. WQ 127309]
MPFEIGAALVKGWTFKTVIQGSSVPQRFIPTLVKLWEQGRFPLDKRRLLTIRPGRTR